MVMWAAGVSPAAENLVPNGDFELASNRRPPTGWVMWGARRYKVPENYTRDTRNPAGGKACFRIHHPANTNGYVVSTPKRAIPARRGMAYTFSFNARTDRPGPSVFYLEGYESLKPYRDAPSPGRFPFKAERRWKRFTFEIHEGRDFRAGRVKFILLAFRVTMDKREAKTLWIDDVVVTERRSRVAAGLIDPATLKPAKLEHRLRKGDALAVVVDARKVVRRATRRAAGVSFHRVAGWTRAPYDKDGKWNLDPALERAVREMRLPMTRFYAVGAERFSVQEAIDKIATVCRKAKIPLEPVVLELETQSATSKISPEGWAAAVLYSRKKGYGFRHWEISNEPYTRKATAFASPDEYAGHVKAVAKAIRKVQPGAQIGVGINPASPAWGSYVLKAAAGSYDFVVGHHYCFLEKLNKASLADAAVTANYAKLNDVLRLNALIRAYNPKRDVYQYDTEWGMHSDSPEGSGPGAYFRNANIYGTLHRAVRLIYYTREDILRGASSWEMFSRTKSPGFGILTPDEPKKAFLIYWLYYYFNRHVGESVVEIAGTAPYYAPEGKPAGPLTPFLATLSKDGRTLYLVAVNASWDRKIPATIELRGFAPGRTRAVTLSQDSRDANPLVNRREDAVSMLPVKVTGSRLTFELPPHCVVFIEVSERGE